MSAIFSN
jgi:hypothetical protein